MYLKFSVGSLKYPFFFFAETEFFFDFLQLLIVFEQFLMDFLIDEPTLLLHPVLEALNFNLMLFAKLINLLRALTDKPSTLTLQLFNLSDQLSLLPLMLIMPIIIFLFLFVFVVIVIVALEKKCIQFRICLLKLIYLLL